MIDNTGKRVDPKAALTVAVRSDGARSIVHTQNHQAGEEVSRTVHYVSGEQVEAGDLWEIKTTWKAKAKPIIAKWHRSPKNNCLTNLLGERFTSATETFVAEETIDGHRAARISRGSATEWYALDAGCAPLKNRHDFGNSVSEQQLIALIPGEPDPALFYAPASFKEVSPSGFSKVMMERLQLPCPERCWQSALRRDKKYEEQNNN